MKSSGVPRASLALLAAGAIAFVLVARWAQRERDSAETPYEPIVVEQGGAPRAVPASLEGQAPAGSERVRFVVEGPCCNGCSQTLYDAALAHEGVAAAAVRFDEVQGIAIGEAWVAAGSDKEGLATALTFDKYAGRILR